MTLLFICLCFLLLSLLLILVLLSSVILQQNTFFDASSSLYSNNYLANNHQLQQQHPSTSPMLQHRQQPSPHHRLPGQHVSPRRSPQRQVHSTILNNNYRLQSNQQQPFARWLISTLIVCPSSFSAKKTVSSMTWMTKLPLFAWTCWTLSIFDEDRKSKRCPSQRLKRQGNHTLGASSATNLDVNYASSITFRKSITRGSLVFAVYVTESTKYFVRTTDMKKADIITSKTKHLILRVTSTTAVKCYDGCSCRTRGQTQWPDNVMLTQNPAIPSMSLTESVSSHALF